MNDTRTTARGAESARDFVHKLGIVLKELNEAEGWIDILVRRKMADQRAVVKIKQEHKSLCSAQTLFCIPPRQYALAGSPGRP